MPIRNPKIAGVMNSGDAATNEMSYVDMHDLHPENVQAAQLNGFVNGSMEGATLATIPAAGIALAMGTAEKGAHDLSSRKFNGKGLAVGAAIVAVGAVVMGAIRSITSKQNAETHNGWSDRVLSRMEKIEAESRHTGAVQQSREHAASQDQSTQIG